MKEFTITFGKTISEEMIKNVIKLKNERKTNSEIKKETNLSLDKIKKICRIENIQKHDYTNYKKPNQEEIIEIQKRYDEIKNLKKVSKECGYSYHILKRVIKLIERPKKEILERKKDVVRNVMNWRKNVKLKLIEYKGGKCEVDTCKYNKSVWSMGFHHQDPKEKDFNISGKSYSFERLKKEVDKCVLLCGNCHGEVHEEIYEKGYSDIINKIINK